ncbi:uncharacterized protein LOC106755811 isoform X2 [Vigna radiata var. radiata]|uniref:Uncharacterized protein LOC106755811 isoform X2 n=1 Tax=Vigna radiata var. radiata TaxID=3916 RepID=A0A3Q0FH79_VIGRR|nr:uncharacterized protein LOC106755811 isoform X2 [Vigna radiata var. radiata]
METVVGLWQGVGICRKGLAPPLAPPLASPPAPHRIIAERRTSVVVSASKSLNWLQKSCKSCGGRALERTKRTEICLNDGNVLIAKDLGSGHVPPAEREEG